MYVTNGFNERGLIEWMLHVMRDKLGEGGELHLTDAKVTASIVACNLVDDVVTNLRLFATNEVGGGGGGG